MLKPALIHSFFADCMSSLLFCCLCATRETLRLDPTVNLVGRVATRDFKLGDYRVPAGQLLSIPLKHLAQHDPRWEGKTGELQRVL